MTGRSCDVPTGDHDGQPRLYACGWRCTSHAPQARTTATTPDAVTPAPARKAVRARHDDPLRVVGALFVDVGEGSQLKDQGPGQFRWSRQPSARYECLACRTSTETVTGPIAVKAFISHIRATHQATCTGATTEGAQAA